VRSILRRAGLAAAILFLATSAAVAQSDAETRVLEYLRDHLQPGQPVVVTDLYNNVFTQPDERQALNKLYGAFFRIPLFVAQYREKFGAPPSLKVIAEQFDLRTPQAADVLLRVMESDPRVPRFLTRDPKTGEITRVDVPMVRADPKFGQALAQQLGGWEGKPLPEFKLFALDGSALDSSSLRGKVALLYVWFTGCPPCMKETPALVAAARDFSPQGFVIVGANADRLLGLSYDDAVRRRYLQEQGINSPVVHWTREADLAFGGVAIYPTIFLADRKGAIVAHWVGYTDPDEIRRAITRTLQEK